jgi:hypothetical protein
MGLADQLLRLLLWRVCVVLVFVPFL